MKKSHIARTESKSNSVEPSRHKVPKTYLVSERQKRLKADEDLILTPKNVKRTACPVCLSRDYVRPYLQGLTEPDDRFWQRVEEGRVAFAPGCEVDVWWEWSCVKCRVLFIVNPSTALQ